jgi:Zn-dependent M16 (insulinase) family peptidase
MCNVNGYSKIDEMKIEELNGIGTVYTHNKSGARICCISNNDENKVFTISFRTPPYDDTGLPHILEHSVLCGSRKFPVKDPFIQLAKGSLNTFLNAMTYSDKTMYPVASCNDKDFENLMDVYLDAVLYPNIYKNPKILQQEGWHYDLESRDGDITYKGVVYNEMKGAFSSPEQVLFRKIQQSLFPDTPYGFESGGDPEYIPDLTDEDFINFHKKYYHPSNSYIFLYGDCNMEEKLTWLDENYLKEFDKIDIDSEIKKQETFENRKEVAEYYPISQNEDINDNTYLSLNYVAGDVTNKSDHLGLEIFEYILLEAPGAPLKQAILDAGIGKDVFGSYDNSILQPSFSIIVKNSNESSKEKFIKIVNDTLSKLSKQGIDKKRIEAALNYFEFKVKEADYGRYPKGVIYAIKAMESWLYGGNPFEHYQYNEAFKQLREGIDKGYFDNIVNQYFLNNNHSSLLVLKPDKELLAKKEMEVAKKLESYKSSLSDEEIDTLINNTKRLEEYQNEEDSRQDLEKIPLLEIDDIKKEITPLEVEELELENTKIIRHPEFTNSIVYIKLIFDTKHVPLELIPYIGLMTRILGKMSTNNYDYVELSNRINTNTGGIKVNATVYGHNDEPTVYYPKLELTGKSFDEKVPELFKLLKEIITNTTFENKNRLREIIAESKSRAQMALNNSGHTSAATRAEAYFSNAAYYRDTVSGITYYNFLEKCDSNFDNMVNEIITNLNKLVNIIFKPANLLIGVTSEKESYGIVNEEIKKFIDSLDQSLINTSEVELELNKRNEGFMTPNKVQYVAKAGNYITEGFKYTGGLKLLQTIITLEYLWNNVRVKGGAYGAMASFKRNGDLYMVSYRDPNLKETINVFDDVYSFVSTFSVDERELTKYIIGTISNLDQPLTPALKGDRVISLYLSKISNEDLQNERNEVLNASCESIRELANLIKSVMKQDNICVIGNENKLEKNKELFGEIKHLFGKELSYV